MGPNKSMVGTKKMRHSARGRGWAQALQAWAVGWHRGRPARTSGEQRYCIGHSRRCMR